MSEADEKDKPSQGEEKTDEKDKPEQEEDLWYFAIGSMMFPRSYEQRNFKPLASYPAELLDYKLNFFSSDGFAEALPAPGDSLHGILHKVTSKQMIELDKIELGYIRKLGKARPYGKWDGKDEFVEATVYCRPTKETVIKPPRERYLEIMIAGAKHFGVDPKYVQMLENHEYQPRTPPEDFRSFGDPPPNSHYAEVPEATKDGKFYFSLNGRVLEVAYPPDHPHHAFLLHIREYKGPHFEVALSQLQLDLKYGILEDINDCSTEQSSFIENNHYRWIEANGDLKYYRIIGTYGGAMPSSSKKAKTDS